MNDCTTGLATPVQTSYVDPYPSDVRVEVDDWTMSQGRQVFDDIDRDNYSYATHSEPTATFLNRVAGLYWDEIRRLLETWVCHYPDGSRPDLIGRLRSPLNQHFRGAFWEVYLHETFLNAGFKVKVHPDVPGGTRRPDFLVSSSLTSYYVEATTIAPNDGGAEARLQRAMDRINTLKCSNFFVDLRIHSVGAQDVSTKRLLRDLDQWLTGLDPDAITVQSILSPDGDKFDWADAGWSFGFRPLPVRADARDLDHNLLGSWGHGGVNLVRDAESIDGALSDKGSAYGQLDHPLVLAINLWSGFREFETMNALYGAAQIRIDHRDPGNVQNVRATDGYWGWPENWKHQHVAGVLLAPNIGPWSIADLVPTFWSHPSPRTEVRPLRHWVVAELDGDQIKYVPASAAPHEFFGLTEGWPGPEPFPNRSAA